MAQKNFADARPLIVEALKAINTGARATATKRKAQAKLDDIAATLAEDFGVTYASLDGGGRGGKGQKGRHFEPVMGWVAEAELSEAELAAYNSGETGRGTPGAKARNKVSEKVRRIRAAFAEAEELTFWEQVHKALATQRNKFEQAPLADTERRESMLRAIGGERKARGYLAEFDAFIARIPKK